MDAERRLILRFEEQRPFPFIVLQHQHLVEIDVVSAIDGLADIEIRYIFQLPLVQLSYGHVLVLEIAVIWTVAEGTVYIVEGDVFNSFLFQGVLNTCLVHSGNLIVNFKGSPGREHNVGLFRLCVTNDDKLLGVLVGDALDFIGDEKMLGQGRSLRIRLLSSG